MCSGRTERQQKARRQKSKVKVVGGLRLGASHHNLAHGAQITPSRVLSPYASRCSILPISLCLFQACRTGTPWLAGRSFPMNPDLELSGPLTCRETVGSSASPVIC